MMPHCFSLLSRGIFLFLARMQCFIPLHTYRFVLLMWSFHARWCKHLIIFRVLVHYENLIVGSSHVFASLWMHYYASFHIFLFSVTIGGSFTHNNITNLFSLTMSHSITDLFSCHFKVKFKLLVWFILEHTLESFEESTTGFITCHLLIST